MKVYIQHLIAILSFLLYFAAGTVSAYPDNDHQITVKGVVLDKTSQPIPGVVVMVKNNQSAGGTITDLDGKFWFNVPVNSVVVFSCMPIEQQVPVILRFLGKFFTESDESSEAISVVFQILRIVFIVVNVVPRAFINSDAPGENLAAHVRLFDCEPIFFTVAQLKANAESVARSPNI